MNTGTGTAAKLNLKQIIFEYLDESQQDRSKYRRMYPIAVRGMMDLMVDVYMYPKTCKLTVEANKTVKLPEDFMQYISVGVLNESGEVATLRHNSNLTTLEDRSYDRLSKNNDSTVYDLFDLYKQFFLNYYFIYPYNNLFGIASGRMDFGSFNIDYNSNVILMDNQFPYGYIVLSYLAFPCEDDFSVPYQAREALIAWMAWKDMATSPISTKVSLNEKVLRRREYYVQKMNAKKKINPLNLSDAGDIYRAGLRLVPKA